MEALLAQVQIRDPNDPSTSCVAENKSFCLNWALDNYDRYVTPTLEHILLVVISVVIGFLIAFAMAYLSHRRTYLVPGFTVATGILFTIPSLAFFFLLLPITGRGRDTAIIALTAFTLQIIYRNIVTGLNNVPDGAKDAGIGMGMTPRQLFWKVEVPLAMPEIVAGLQVATVSTVAIATLAAFAGGGGLGTLVFQDITFKTGVVITGFLVITMAVIFQLLLMLLGRLLAPWRGAEEGPGRDPGMRAMLRRTAT